MAGSKRMHDLRFQTMPMHLLQNFSCYITQDWCHTDTRDTSRSRYPPEERMQQTENFNCTISSSFSNFSFRNHPKKYKQKRKSPETSSSVNCRFHSKVSMRSCNMMQSTSFHSGSMTLPCFIYWMLLAYSYEATRTKQRKGFRELILLRDDGEK